MTPAARLQAAIDILSGLENTRQSADQYLRQWFRTRRFAGSKDRAAIAERVFTVARHRASFAWRMKNDAPRALVIASLLAEGADIASLFTGGYGPEALSPDEIAMIAAPVRADAPACVAGEFPAFLEAELRKAFGENLLEEMRAMQGRAPVDLRVNGLKARKDEVLAALGDTGIVVTSARFAPDGIRVASAEGLSALGRSALFEAGAFEFQDEAAQIASILCGAKPGMRVLDLAAGAGGKSLALAAAMRNKGEIVAFDIDAARLARLDERAARAGASIIRTTTDKAALGKGYDIVLVDAPCSGTGTWRRQPESRWRLTADMIAGYRKAQAALLDDAAGRVKEGGRLVYATCSLLPCENAEQVTDFRARHKDFRVLPAAQFWAAETGASPPPGMGEVFSASPCQTGTDGFFAALLLRN